MPPKNPNIPTPGSRLAKALGCRCPTWPNNFGERQPYEEGWIITLDCELHNR